MDTEQQSFPVDEGERWIGLVTIQSIRSAPRQQWDSRSVKDVTIPPGDLVLLTPDADANEALEQVIEQKQDQLPVVEQDRVRGFLRQNDVMKWLALQTPADALSH